jgi:short-subunit dehydrogenase
MTDRRVFISGATGYLGRIVTKRFADEGYDLILGGRDVSLLEEVKTTLSDSHSDIEVDTLYCNFSEPTEWPSVEKILDQHSIHGFVNCVGIQGPISKIQDVKQEDLLKVMTVNLFAPISFTNYFASRSNATIVTKIVLFSGGGATTARPLFLPYSLSKTALVRFVENFSSEHLSSEIAINAIAPGVLPSKMQLEIMQSSITRDTRDWELASNSLSSNERTHLNLLSLCSFLMSNRSDGISGKIISAEWDDWQSWPAHIEELSQSDLYTLRRITGRDRGNVWGDL